MAKMNENTISVDVSSDLKLLMMTKVIACRTDDCMHNISETHQCSFKQIEMVHGACDSYIDSIGRTN